MSEKLKGALHVGEPKPRSNVARKKSPPPTVALGESIVFADWADEFRILTLYRNLIVRGDNAIRSLGLIREALERWGAERVEQAIREYQKEADPEPRFRKRPFSFFQADIIEQYIPTGEPAKDTAIAQANSIDELKAALAASKKESPAAD